MGKGKETACKAAAILGITMATFGCVLPDEQEKNEILNNNDNNPGTVITAPAPSFKETASNITDCTEKYLDLKEAEEEIKEEGDINSSQKTGQTAAPPPDPTKGDDIPQSNTNTLEEVNAMNENDLSDFGTIDNPDEISVDEEDDLSDFGTLDSYDEDISEETADESYDDDYDDDYDDE